MENDREHSGKITCISRAGIRRLLRRMRETEAEMQDTDRQLGKLHAKKQRCEQRLQELRGALSGLVEQGGGAVLVPELGRAIYVKTVENLEYDKDTLMPWLIRNAPGYLRHTARRKGIYSRMPGASRGCAARGAKTTGDSAAQARAWRGAGRSCIRTCEPAAYYKSFNRNRREPYDGGTQAQ